MPVDPELLRQIAGAVAAKRAPRRDQAPALQVDGADQDSLSAALAARGRLYNQVDAGYREASDEWGQAEAALSKALRSANQLRSEGDKEEDGSLSPLRQQGSVQTIGSETSHLHGGGIPSGGSDGEERTRRISEVRELAFMHRAQRMRNRATDAAKKLQDHAKRRLRVKIGDILKEVRRRQALRRQQERARRFREHRHKQGRGMNSSIGDADEFALGLGISVDDADGFAQGGATPRRRCILESLSLEELAMVRRNPRFFLEPGSNSGHGGSDGEEESHEGLENLIDFFTPARKDKDLPIESYAQKLQSRLAQATEMVAQDRKDAQQAVEGGSSWQSLLRGGRSSNSSGGLSKNSPPGSGGGLGAPSANTSVVEPFVPTSSMMTSVISSCRRAPVRNDEASPTLQKVKEVYNRKEELDAKVLEERQLAMEQRIARNAFKAAEQQREFQLTQFKQKELHKVRMLEAAERKQALEAEAQERINLLDASKLRKMRMALDQADDELERKRDKATDALEAWGDGVRRSQRYLRHQERRALAEHKANEEAYIERLVKVGEARSTAPETQAQKNDKLKSRIQLSLIDQLEEQRRVESDQLAIALDEKLAVARYRRQHRRTKYNFLERAFGDQIEFDPKFSYTASRMGGPWKAKGLLSPGGSSSSPNL